MQITQAGALRAGPPGVQPEASRVLNDPACIRLMREFIAARPELWNEDIGR